MKAKKDLTELSLQVAHDIRSPLSVLNLLVHQTHGLPDTNAKLIREACKRIFDIANTLISSGHHGVETSSAVDVVESLVLEKTIELMERPEVSIDLTINCDPDVEVRMPPSLLARVLSNLLNNAIEASRGENRIQVSLFQQQDQIRIEIRDHGHGIPKSMLARIGKRGLSLGKRMGTGLGLAHAKKSVEDVGGRIVIQSQFRRGTTVSLVLPVNKRPSSSAES